MYDWHNYGNSTIGARSDIENVRIENLQAFYRTYYQPDNAVLTIAGKFDEKKVLNWVAQSFGKIPRPKRALPALWTAEPTHDGERTVAVRRKGEVQIVLVGYRCRRRCIPTTWRRPWPRTSSAIRRRTVAPGAGGAGQGGAGVRVHDRRGATRASCCSERSSRRAIRSSR